MNPDLIDLELALLTVRDDDVWQIGLSEEAWA